MLAGSQPWATSRTGRYIDYDFDQIGNVLPDMRGEIRDSADTSKAAGATLLERSTG